MDKDDQIQKIIDDIVEQEMRGCVNCGSHVDLVFCEGIESYVTKREGAMLCWSCRQEWLFTDEGLIDHDQLEELAYRASLEDDEEE
ncbi:hypothetical protein [Picosynechococcus sp. PCC 8807]|uniref:hypothetical protein n=1 Tax=Picosynechococcus sp. PCC 8807 TaxID=195248 RepID=UPI000810BF65|nr:hypothetical protein [Picosynechococcus sp. PCC 8807]ANV90788.1 hypothetical protein AWQ24_09170 [Picosynechococcus sp. PCC 8807]